MKIGIDISPLQGPHRLRGVGAVVANIINHMPDNHKSGYSFVFFAEKNSESITEALSILNLDGLNYEVRTKPNSKSNLFNDRKRGFVLVLRGWAKLTELVNFKFGAKGYDGSELDSFILTDQLQVMPRMKGVRKIMLAYDLIPYILEWEYLWSYKTARGHGLSRKGALAAQFRRYDFRKKISINVKKSDKVLAISEQTRNDFIELVGAKPKKTLTLYLGVDRSSNLEKKMPTHKFTENSWGYFPKPLSIYNDTPYILFVGGTDARRKLSDLVTAFNHLSAKGMDINLILTGDVLQGPDNLPVKESREALLNSSYKKNIYYLGFVSESNKRWLYQNALAFIYPSTYEGFGLPVLEAMANSCPVICYPNEATKEVAKDIPIYASNALEIMDGVKLLLSMESSEKSTMLSRGLKQTEKYTWENTANGLIKAVAE